LPAASAKYTRQGGRGAIGNRRLLLLLLDAWLVTTATYGAASPHPCCSVRLPASKPTRTPLASNTAPSCRHSISPDVEQPASPVDSAETTQDDELACAVPGFWARWFSRRDQLTDRFRAACSACDVSCVRILQKRVYDAVR